MKILLAFAALGILSTGAFTNPVPAELSFKNDVTPVLKKYCFNCHSGERADKGLKVDSYDRLMKGTNYGVVVKAGKSAESVIIKSVKGQPGGSKMPPGRRTMKEAEIKILADWIDQGAKNN
jgi:uncharacterized membrane protein